MVHPTAVIHPKAEIGPDCEIGPYCVIGEHVVMGEGCRLISHVVVDGHTRLGKGNIIYPFASVGLKTQDLNLTLPQNLTGNGTASTNLYDTAQVNCYDCHGTARGTKYYSNECLKCHWEYRTSGTPGHPNGTFEWADPNEQNTRDLISPHPEGGMKGWLISWNTGSASHRAACAASAGKPARSTRSGCASWAKRSAQAAAMSVCG